VIGEVGALDPGRETGHLGRRRLRGERFDLGGGVAGERVGRVLAGVGGEAAVGVFD